LDIYNGHGELVRTFMDGNYDRGSYLVTWFPDEGRTIQTDNYTYKLKADDLEIFGIFSNGDQVQQSMDQLNNEVFTVVEKMPEFPGGMDALAQYLVNNIEYPKQAINKGTSGRVFVNFVIKSNGSISDVKVLRGIGDGCDEEAVRVVQNMPDWKPGEQRGKKVSVSYNIPIKFSLDDDKVDSVFTVVEEMPKFPGGEKALINYLAKNIKYPDKAKKDKVQGRVFVSFVVEKDGSIGDVKVLRGIGGGCDEESIRVVQNMPNWTPGMQRGKAVRVAYNLPIKFSLD
jgi:TonB family protein